MTPKELSPVHTPRALSPDRRHDDRDQDGNRRDDRGGNRGSKSRHRDDSPSSVSSGDTIELPPRFDAYGRPRDADPLASRLEAVLSGLFR